MKLKQLCLALPDVLVRNFRDVEISGITSNSKVVAPNTIFIAKKGARNDGANFIPEALSHGASVIATDVFDPTLTGVVQLIHPDIHALEAKLANAYYGRPSEELWMVAVTGTCGKTTTTYAIKHLLEKHQTTSGLIGTIEYAVGQKRYSATHTTPDICANQKLIREMVTHGCKACVMEVTSHALHQDRVSGIEFDVAVFTNLNHDHLDYHGSMDHYFEAKSALFRGLKNTKTSKKAKLPKVALINADDPWKEKFIASTATTANVITYGIDQKADIQAHSIHFGQKGTEFVVSYNRKEHLFSWPLVGRFNVYNALACIGVGLIRGISLEEIADSLREFQTAPGRLDVVQNRLGAHVFIDYAHKPEALRNVLKTLKELAKGRVIVLFGCGGDRDREKRPIMGRIAEELADVVIVTSDNPRSEDPQKIIQEILKGLKNPTKAIVEVDRKKAIYAALLEAKPTDIVLIAGRGHETKQIVSHLYVDFDDKLIASQCCDEIYHKKILQMAGTS
jgi:UDP-N-acetylmuramoyl-L-alanyl-D-glutamate--2,6-diaminopimelate ligase